MQQAEFEKGTLVAATWQLALSDDVDELLAIMCTIRNEVIRRGAKGYMAAISRFLESFPLRGLPQGNEPALIDPIDGALARVDGVYSNTFPDVTASAAFPLGASCFADPRRDPGFAAGRKLIGRFGTLAFYE